MTSTTTEESLKALNKTYKTIHEIRQNLEPFLVLVREYHHHHPSKQHLLSREEQQIRLYNITEAEAALALSIGTLRFMAERLKGRKDVSGTRKNGRGQNGGSGSDPLRMELDRIRKTLIELRKLKKKVVGTMKTSLTSSSSSSSSEKKTNNTREQNIHHGDDNKRRRIK